MQALKISAHIQNGVITLPFEYRHLNLQDVEIIVLGEHLEDNTIPIDANVEKIKRKEQLIAAFEGLKNIKSFQEIEDPVKWQREQRDEWE